MASCPVCGDALSRQYNCGGGWDYYCYRCDKRFPSEMIDGSD